MVGGDREVVRRLGSRGDVRQLLKCGGIKKPDVIAALVDQQQPASTRRVVEVVLRRYSPSELTSSAPAMSMPFLKDDCTVVFLSLSLRVDLTQQTIAHTDKDGIGRSV